MIKRGIIFLFIILISLSFFTFVFADEASDVTNNSETILIASSDNNDDNREPQRLNSDEGREFKTSRKYSFQIFVGLLILIALYRFYKFIKYRR